MKRPRARGPATIDSAEVAFEPSSGNVFADLGLPNPQVAMAKAALVQRLRSLLEKRGVSQVEAAKLLGIDQPKVSKLLSGQTEGFTIDRLLRFVGRLGHDFHIVVGVRPVSAATKT